MPVQKCPMCLEEKEVVSSHLMPAALYDYCRTATDKPVRVGNGVIMHTDRQLQHDLLCLDCEGVLNRGGESWANRKFASIKDGFRLYDLVTSVPPEFQDADGAWYSAANNSLIDVEKLAHFALGIFWKASVHPWRAHERTPMIELGPYSEAVRTWLRGETSFPKHVCLSVVVSRPEKALITLSVPVETRTNSWHTFFFNVPGAIFILNTGKDIDPEMRATCFHESLSHPILVSDHVTAQLWMRAGRDYAESRKSNGYLKAKAKRAKARGIGT